MQHYASRTQLRVLARVASLARAVWALGLAARFTLSVAVVVAVLAGLARAPENRLLPIDTLITLCQSTGFVLAWSVGVATATQLHPVALLAVSPWLIFYVVLISGAVIGTPLAPVPLLWLAWALWRSLVRLPRTWLFAACWALASGLVGYPLPGISGLRRVLGWPFGITWLVTALVFFLPGLLSARRWASVKSSVPRFGTMLAGSLAMCSVLVVAATIRNTSSTVEWIEIVSDDASAIVVLLFMWTAGRFAEGAFGLTSWTVRQSARLLPVRLVPAVAFLTIGAVTLVELIQLTGPDANLLNRLSQMAHAALGMLSLALLAWWARRSALSHPRVLMVAISWIAGWLILQGLLEFATAAAQSRQLAVQLSGTGLLIAAAGLAFDIGKLAHPSSHDLPAKLYLPLGTMTIASVSAICLLLVAGDAWEMRRSLMVLTGALHLGIPMVVARARRSMAGVRTPSSAPCLTSFASGYACALGILLIAPRDVWALLGTLPVLMLLLQWFSRAYASSGADGGALVGALFGGGVVAGWMMPYPPTVPFLPRPSWIELLRDWAALGRPPLTLSHAVLLLAAWLTGAVLGWVWFRRHAVTSSF